MRAPNKIRQDCIDKYNRTGDIQHLVDLCHLYIFYADPKWFRELKIKVFEYQKTASVAALAVMNKFFKKIFNVIITLEDD